MKALFTLTSSESKRLIAQGVKELPAVQNALADHTIIVAGGTTNAYVAEELLGIHIEDKAGYTVGIVINGETGISTSTNRTNPFVITNGKPQDMHWKEYLPHIKPGDVFIKGGNAVDSTGLAAVMVSDAAGGTIGLAMGTLYARGIKLIVPIGLEKMVPDVQAAIEFMSLNPVDEAIGTKVGLIPILGATVVTELDALETLFNVDAYCIAAGGVAGSEGSVTLAIEGSDAEIAEAIEFIKSIKNEPPIK